MFFVDGRVGGISFLLTLGYGDSGERGGRRAAAAASVGLVSHGLSDSPSVGTNVGGGRSSECSEEWRGAEEEAAKSCIEK